MLTNSITYAEEERQHFWYSNIESQPTTTEVNRRFNPMKGMTVIGSCDWVIQVLKSNWPM